MTVIDQPASRWLATECEDADLRVVGVPSSRSSGSRADLAPLVVRDHLRRFSTFDGVSGADIASVRARDHGNWPVSSIEPTRLIRDLAERARDLPPGVRVYLGGDNAITRPLVSAAAVDISDVGLICFDSEHGADSLFGGPTDRNPIRGLIEDGLPGQNVVQIGIHPLANTRSARSFCDESGVTTVTADQVEKIGVRAAVDVAVSQLSAQCETVYVNVDLGVLDAVFAPAATSARPGGITVRDLALGVARCTEHHRIGAVDLVGVDPEQDEDGRTLEVMAYLLLAAAGGLARR